MSKLIDLIGLSEFLKKCKGIFIGKPITKGLAVHSGCVASGRYSVAKGYTTTASGDYSNAEGNDTVANGPNSHVEGFQTRTFNSSEHAEGKWNKSNANTISSVGIGSAHDDRKNAFEIMQNGNAYLYGVGGYDGTNPFDATPINQLIGQGGAEIPYLKVLGTFSSNQFTAEDESLHDLAWTTFVDRGGIVVLYDNDIITETVIAVRDDVLITLNYRWQ